MPEEQCNGGEPSTNWQRAPECTRPLIYVASLADYNNGRLHGVWIHADRSPDAIRSTIQAMLAASPEPCAHDWEIHDYEGFGAACLDPSLGIEVVSQIARHRLKSHDESHVRDSGNH